MLLEQILDKPRAWLLAHDDECLTPQQYGDYLALVKRRCDGEPMAYLTGWRAFMDFDLQVTPDVLIPRPETELLVEIGLTSIAAISRPRVLDLGTGSGAVAIAIARLCPHAIVTATDLSQSALRVAQANAQRLGVEIEFLIGDWYESLMIEREFDLILSNPPYIDCQDRHLLQGDLRFEPKQALTDGANGLQAIRRIVNGAPSRLKPGASLWIEHGFDQGAAVREFLLSGGLKDVRTNLDLAGLERVSGGLVPAV